MAKCSSLERHEENLIAKAKKWRAENPDASLDPLKGNTPNYFVKFRGVVGRVQRDRGLRQRLYPSYLNQSSRMDKFVIAKQRYYRYAFVLKKQIRDERERLEASQLKDTFFVPNVPKIPQRLYSVEMADDSGYTLDGEIKQLSIDGIVAHMPLTSVVKVNRQGMEDWITEYEVIVPNKYDNDDLARESLVHPSSLPPDPHVVSNTGIGRGEGEVLQVELGQDDVEDCLEADG